MVWITAVPQTIVKQEILNHSIIRKSCVTLQFWIQQSEVLQDCFAIGIMYRLLCAHCMIVRYTLSTEHEMHTNTHTGKVMETERANDYLPHQSASVSKKLRGFTNRMVWVTFNGEGVDKEKNKWNTSKYFCKHWQAFIRFLHSQEQEM